MTGDHNITVEIDYTDIVSELNELNNKLSEVIEVVDPNPTASIVTPLNGAEAYATTLTLLAGYGTDVKDSELNESFYNWTSDVDGYLGDGSVLYANLSSGDHVIFFTVEDSDGNKDIDQVIISVLASEPPVAVINSPIDNEIFIEGEIIYFDGSALDHEDGDLTGSSLIWNSSVDGYLGLGESFNLNSLSVGIHNITFTATDSSGLISIDFVNLTIEESTPNVIINYPVNGSDYYYNQNNITFNGTANDRK